MKFLTIRQRIIASFAVVLTLMMIMAALAYVRLGDIERKAALIQIDSIPGLTLTNQIVVERVANYSL
ncbi:MAG: methyl-accepting chemotaxis protein, partial [Acidobacteriota bacterium]